MTIPEESSGTRPDEPKGDPYLAAAVKARRLKLKLTQDQLASAIGKSKGYISGVENTKWGARFETLKALATALECSINELSQLPGDETEDGWRYVDVPQYQVPLGLSPTGRVHDEHVEIAGYHKYQRKWVEQHGWRLQDLAVTFGDGQSMAPNIKHGDKLLVHLAENDRRKLISGEVYVITDPYLGPRAKRLFDLEDGRILVRSDNEDKGRFPDEYLTPESTVYLVGRVVDRSGPV